jgi:glutaredoxin-dependent peroxiredoxin
MSVEVGSKAPDFTLTNQDLQPVSLGSQAGRNVVLAFFPAAFSSVCTRELCHFRDTLGSLHDLNATVLGISVDMPLALKAFATQQQLTFPLLSDFNKEVSDSYGVLNPNMFGLRGVANRAVFVIDGGGVVRHKEVTPGPGDEPDYAQVEAALAAIAEAGATGS